MYIKNPKGSSKILLELIISFRKFAGHKVNIQTLRFGGFFFLYKICLAKVQPLLIWWEQLTWHQCKLAAKENGLEYARVNNDDFTVLVREGSTPLSEHVHYVAITLKMTEQAKQQICIQFCVKLEHSSMETLQMVQKATGMGNWWLAASSLQHACSCIIIMSCAEFSIKHQVTQVTQSP